MVTEQQAEYNTPPHTYRPATEDEREHAVAYCTTCNQYIHGDDPDAMNHCTGEQTTYETTPLPPDDAGRATLGPWHVAPTIAFGRPWGVFPPARIDGTDYAPLAHFAIEADARAAAEAPELLAATQWLLDQMYGDNNDRCPVCGRHQGQPHKDNLSGAPCAVQRWQSAVRRAKGGVQ